MGLSPEEVEAITPSLKDEGDGVYSAIAVPVVHPAFESYILAFSSQSGLCAVSGIGKDIDSGQTGAEVRSAFESLAESLTNKYGKSKKFDFATGPMDDPEYWMIALSDKNRTLAMYWDREEKSDLPADLLSIALEAHASDISTGFLNLRYQFSNMVDCANEAKHEQEQAL